MSAFEPRIAVEDLRKDYGPRRVLVGVDLEVRAGEVFALLGPNGAGKTTTIEILEGYRTATSGRVRVLGVDPATSTAALRERIGVVLQECGFPKHLRVGELLDSWRRYYPRPRPLEELLEVVELREERQTLVRRLSGGQRRRLDFALALAGDPDIVFLDEPTTGFDPEARRRCWRAIDNLRGLGKTILLTTHYLDEAERLADRVAILAAGRIRAVGSPRELARRSAAPTTISFSLPVRLAGTATLPPWAASSVQGDRVVVRTQDTAESLEALLAWGRHRGMAHFEDLAVTPPTLEDVYLELVGQDEEILS